MKLPEQLKNTKWSIGQGVERRQESADHRRRHPEGVLHVLRPAPLEGHEGRMGHPGLEEGVVGPGGVVPHLAEDAREQSFEEEPGRVVDQEIVLVHLHVDRLDELELHVGLLLPPGQPVGLDPQDVVHRRVDAPGAERVGRRKVADE